MDSSPVTEERFVGHAVALLEEHGHFDTRLEIRLRVVAELGVDEVVVNFGKCHLRELMF